MPLKPTAEIAEFYSDIVTFKRYWTDHCNHPPEYYLCSFAVNPFNCPPERYDLYLFPSFWGNDLCFRYGSEDHQYLSPGNVEEFMLRNHNDVSYFAQTPYGVVMKILKEYGKLTYALKSTPKQNENTKEEAL